MSKSLRDFEDIFQAKLDEYKKNPALFFIDIFPHTTDQQRAMLQHFLINKKAQFKVDPRDSNRFKDFAKLVFFNFLRHPDELTVIVLPGNYELQRLITGELITLLDQFRRSFFLGGLLDPQLKITPDGLIRRDYQGSGIRFKRGIRDIAGLPMGTTYICYSSNYFTRDEWDLLLSTVHGDQVISFNEVMP